MRGASIAVALALVSASATVRAGSADDLAEARRLKAALDWEHALDAAERALDDGDADPARVRELHQLAGELAAGLDRDDVAIAHFEALLELAPDATLPPGTSPKITARFDVARARAQGRPALAIRLERRSASVELIVDHDPLALVAWVRAHVHFPSGAYSDPIVRVIPDLGSAAIAVPDGADDVQVFALDAHFNVVWSARAPAPLAPPPPPPPAIHHDWTATTTWAVVAGGSLALGAIGAWRTQVAQDEWNALRADDGHHDYSALTAVETRGRRWALGADVAFGAAAVTGAIAIVVGIREARRAPDGVAVAPIVTRDALGVALGARF
jgi:hypothetical protein